MKKVYENPVFELLKIEITDVILVSPVEQYASEVNTDPGGWDEDPTADPNF